MARRRRTRMRFRFRRPPWWLLLGTVVGVAAIVVLLTRPTGSSPVPVRAGDMAPAAKALETKLGGPQRYTEINATDKGVNLFVAVDGANEVAWYYEAGRLDGPGPSQAAAPDHTPFGLENVALGRAAGIARNAVDRSPTATMRAFTLRQEGQLGLVWALDFQSSRGGLLHMTYAPGGGFIGVDAQ